MAYDAFLKLEGMDGESTDDKYSGYVEVASFSMGITHMTTVGSATGGAGSGRTSVGELQISKVVDKSSAVLFQKCATGEHFSKGKLIVRKAGGTQMEYLIYSMENVFVTSIHFSSASGEENANESLSLAYGKVGFDYTPQKPDGSPGAAIHGGWDQIANKKY
ncbi:MAG TPA: type VI secretion system tube protein Hcp [Bryobacteraceae bacterium]